MKNSCRRGALLLLCFLLLTSCVHKTIIDEVQIISVLGFDKTDNGYHGISMFADYKKSELGDNFLLEADGKRARIILSKMSDASSRPISIAKLKVMIVGERFAREGINQFSETICIDPKVSSNVYMVISEAPMIDIFTMIQARDPEHLENLLTQTMENGNFPTGNMHYYLKNYFSKGQDSSLPIIDVGPQQRVSFSGYGIFKRDQLKMKINYVESFLFKLMLGDHIYGVYPADIMKGGAKKEIVFHCMSGGLKQKYYAKDHVRYVVRVKGFFQDYPENMFTSDNQMLIQELEHNLEQQLDKLVRSFQKAKLDPIGFGNFVRQHQRDWNADTFYEQVYPNMKVDIEVKVDMQETDQSGKNSEGI
ncbi:Ger(x)C family spore germination protein [Paenibacillus aquistagni]|uniref:Germination protein, Ger(X)C family n=1 Tax=Paenibacillus aquistagni TaxID=1852522 RepID=A0A1X7IW80_9BACL|nr:Ger(x)C family spore germination protein [Paenibacillus aquistagni]SMG19412.1 germination protein, Ger(x)C family [Paenibacillus aquistagni]